MSSNYFNGNHLFKTLRMLILTFFKAVDILLKPYFPFYIFCFKILELIIILAKFGHFIDGPAIINNCMKKDDTINDYAKFLAAIVRQSDQRKKLKQLELALKVRIEEFPFLVSKFLINIFNVYFI